MLIVIFAQIFVTMTLLMSYGVKEIFCAGNESIFRHIHALCACLSQDKKILIAEEFAIHIHIMGLCIHNQDQNDYFISTLTFS